MCYNLLAGIQRWLSFPCVFEQYGDGAHLPARLSIISQGEVRILCCCSLAYLPMPSVWYGPHHCDRAFPVAAARVWNSLPDLVTSAPSIAVFRSWLKTHLFKISYPSPLWLYSACAVTFSCFGHYNRSCLLTYCGGLGCLQRELMKRYILITNASIEVTLHD